MAAYTCILILHSPSFTATGQWDVAPPSEDGRPIFEPGDTVSFQVTSDGSVAFWDNVPASAVTVNVGSQRISSADPFGAITVGQTHTRPLPLANAKFFSTAPLALKTDGNAARYRIAGTIVAAQTPDSNPYSFTIEPLEMGVSR